MTTEVSTNVQQSAVATVEIGEKSVTFAKGKGEAVRNMDTALLLGGKARSAALDEIAAHVLSKAINGRPESATQYLLDRFPVVQAALALTQGPTWRDMAGKGCKERFAEVCQAVLCVPTRGGKDYSKAQKEARSMARAFLRTEGLTIRAEDVVVEAQS